MQKKKMNLISHLDSLQKNHNPNLQETQSALKDTSRAINEKRYELHKEFSKSHNDFQVNKEKQVNCRDSDNSFLNINRIFRPLDQQLINKLKLDNIDTATAKQIGINDSNSQKIGADTAITDPGLILNALGAYFEKVNEAPPHRQTLVQTTLSTCVLKCLTQRLIQEPLLTRG